MSFAPRIIFAALIAAGLGTVAAVPSMAQEPSAATLAFMAQDPVVVGIPEAEIQSVQPALAAYALAVDRIQADRASGNSIALPEDFSVAAQARGNLISAQLAASQALMPQLDANAQTVLQARDQVLAAQAVSTRAQQRRLAIARTNALAAAISGAAGVTTSARVLPLAAQNYVAATERLQADQVSGNSGAAVLDAAAVRQAQQTLFSAEFAAGLSAQPQLASAAQAARQSLLVATQQLAADRANGNSAAMLQAAMMIDLANQTLANTQAAAKGTPRAAAFAARRLGVARRR